MAGLATGLVAGMSPMDILNTLGTAFITNRTATLFILTLPVIGLCAVSYTHLDVYKRQL